jgi:hypothetical protein|tara:strand:+ start:57345 stop:58097 length:753 start_codon:yes stop_codon:yes gene_type:complete
MTQIIGFTGRKCAGKDTACNFILAVKLAELGVCKGARLAHDGSVEVSDVFDEKVQGEEWFSFSSPCVDTEALFNDRLGDSVRIYAFAKKLKELSIDLFNLDPKLVFGSDKDKNTKTELLWKNMPTNTKKKGKMSIREVLQYVGTDLFRKMSNNIWVDNCLHRIANDSPEIALISDVRFENEVVAIQEAGGYVVGLTRHGASDDTHDSEVSVEKCLELCDAIIDNEKLTIPEQNEQIYNTTKHLDIFPEMG